MPEPADRPPSLRERLAEALRKAAYVCPGDGCPHDENTCGVGEPIVLAAATYIDGEPEGTLIDGEVTAIAGAVLPVVEAATAALRQRIEEVEDQRDQALAWQDTAERELRNAERRLDAAERIAGAFEAERDKARAAVADEQRRADERRTELLEERDEALNALADAERQARERAAVELEERIQAMRENGDNDMRTVLAHIRDVLRSKA